MPSACADDGLRSAPFSMRGPTVSARAASALLEPFGLVMAPAAAGPNSPTTAPTTAPTVPPTIAPTGPATATPTAAPAADPATMPPPTKTDLASRSASSGSKGSCAAEAGSCDGTPWSGRACSARSASTGTVRGGGVMGWFMESSCRVVVSVITLQAAPASAGASVRSHTLQAPSVPEPTNAGSHRTPRQRGHGPPG